MPVQQCVKNGEPGYSCGPEGKCYLIRDHGEDAAKQLACEQCLAIGEPCSEEDAKMRVNPKNNRKRRPHSDRLVVPVEFKQAGDEANAVIGYASVFGPPPDEHGDIVVPGAFKKTISERIKAGLVKFMDSHVYDAAHTLGAIVEASEDEHGLKFRARLSEAPSVADIKTKMTEGIIDKLSIGYDVVREHYGRDPATGNMVRYLDEVKLYEVSAVPIPALERANILAVKGLVAYQDLPLAARDREWNAKAAEQRVRAKYGGGSSLEDLNWSKYRKAFLWYDNDDPQNVASYKMPIADIIDGTLTAVPQAIFEAAAALSGSGGGMDMKSNKQNVENNVARYYAKMRDEFDDDSIVAPWESPSKTFNDPDQKEADGVYAAGLNVAGVNDQDLIDLFAAIRDLWAGYPQPQNRRHFLAMGLPVMEAIQERGLSIDEGGAFANQVRQIIHADRLEPHGEPKAGRRHSEVDRGRIREAITKLMELFSDDEITSMMTERNKPQAGKEAAPGPDEGSRTSRSQRLRELSLKQFELSQRGKS